MREEEEESGSSFPPSTESLSHQYPLASLRCTTINTHVKPVRSAKDHRRDPLRVARTE